MTVHKTTDETGECPVVDAAHFGAARSEVAESATPGSGLGIAAPNQAAEGEPRRV